MILQSHSSLYRTNCQAQFLPLATLSGFVPSVFQSEKCPWKYFFSLWNQGDRIAPRLAKTSWLYCFLAFTAAWARQFDTSTVSCVRVCTLGIFFLSNGLLGGFVIMQTFLVHIAIWWGNLISPISPMLQTSIIILWDHCHTCGLSLARTSFMY